LIILSLILFTANIVSALTKGDFIINLASSGTGSLYVGTDPERARFAGRSSDYKFLMPSVCFCGCCQEKPV